MLVALALAGCSTSANDSSRGFEAEHYCKEFVKQRLKAPSTAKFQNTDHSGTGSTFTVTGTVDSNNSFGAQIRSPFTCVVHRTSSSWELRSLSGL